MIANRHQAGRSKRLDHHGRGKADYAVAVQILVEGGLQRFQSSAASRHNANDIGEVVAAAVGVPDRVLIAARHLPGHVVTTCCLFRADGRPGPILAGYNGHAAILQFRAGPTSEKKEIASDLRQAGRSKRFNHRRHG